MNFLNDIILIFIFLIMTKILNLDFDQMTSCIAFYVLVVKLHSNFNFGEDFKKLHFCLYYLLKNIDLFDVYVIIIIMKGS